MKTWCQWTLAALLVIAAPCAMAAEKAKTEKPKAEKTKAEAAAKAEPAPTEAAPAEAPAAAAPADAAADPGMGGYGKMQIEHVGLMDGTLDGRISKMSGGVKIKLIADKEGMQDLPIKAQTMTFTYAEGESKPSRIVLEGGVDIQHPQANVTAEKADWNMEKGELVFTGNPVMKSERVKEMRGSKMVLNFEKNAFQVTDARIPEIETNQPGGAGPAGGGMSAPGAALSEGDITDWPGFVAALKSAALSDAATPGKQLATRGGEQMQSALKSMPAEELLKNKGMILKVINGILKKPGFYNKAAWADAPQSDELKALLAKDKLEAAEQVRQNLLLLQAAFPAFIAAQ